MGSNHGDDDERPVHKVNLDAFWIDQTEVTNAMYAKCVDAGKCNSPSLTYSSTRSSYYENPKYDKYRNYSAILRDKNRNVRMVLESGM